MSECIEHIGNDGRSTVKLQLGNILAGFAVWRGKPQHQRFVDDVCIFWIAYARQDRLAWLGHPAGQLFKRNAGFWAGHPDHRDRRRWPTGG